MRISRTRIFSIIVALFPILSSYVSPIPKLDLASFVLILFTLFSLQINGHRRFCIPIYFYILFLTPIMIFISPRVDSNITTIFFRYTKFVVLLGSVFALGNYAKYYDEKNVFDVIKKVIYISAFYILLQRLFYLFGFLLKNPLLQYAIDDAYIVDYTIMEKFLFRPSAFFLEPSHLAVYAVVFLIYSLFKENNLMNALVATFAILASGSGMGLVICIFLYCVYFVVYSKRFQIKMAILMLFGIAMVLFMSRMSFFIQVVSRFTTKNISGGGNAILARIGDGYNIFLEKEFLFQLFGYGYGNVPAGVYLNGATYILNTLGIVGGILFICTLIKYICKGEKWQKIGGFVLMGLTFVSQTFTPANLVFYLCIYKRREVTQTTNSINQTK